MNSSPSVIPPDVEKIIEKTAVYVAKNGSSFEARVLEMNRNNPKFYFLLESDPFHSYYLQVLQEKRRYFAGPPTTPTSSTIGMDHSLAPGESQPNLRGESIAEAAPAVSKAKLSERKAQAARPIPTQPPPEDVFTAQVPEEPLPTPMDVDIMKLTAQFIARNGRSFLQELHSKEYRNPQFEFLKPTHPYFTFFQRLVDAYSIVIAPDDQMLEKIKESAHSLGKVMEDLYYRIDWDMLQEEKKTEQNRSAVERVQMQMIDWHDFVIVETIDLDEREVNLPAPMANGNFSSWNRRTEMMNGKQTESSMEQDDDMEMDMQEEEEEVEVTTYTDIPADKIRKDYRPRTSSSSNENRDSIEVTLPSGQRVPVDRANESIKMELLDPKYKEERQRAAEKNKYQNLASDAEVAMNLGRLSDQKLDIYNRADLQNVMAERRIAEDRKSEESMEQVKAPEPTVQLKPSSLLWEASSSWDKGENMNPARMDNQEDNSEEGIQVHVRVQSHSNQEWNLRGQTISLQVPYQATLLDLKSTLAPLVKLAPNKQKISADNFGYLKDNLSLADYQFYDGIVMYLEVKERGGKKK
ncbi:Probable splicing factor 3A subunit 1 [Galdieria sulphuraria]|nr:Probable splicing factor 3A subunit 1 [Galdieria sulphuraria]